MVKRTLILCLLTCSFATGFAQKDTSFSRANKNRLWITTAANTTFWTGSYIALNKAWYADYPRSAFHFFNDNEEWNQMDKAGHAWTTYTLSRASGKMWKWAGVNDNSAAILGGASGLIYQSIIEVQDGFSSEWGFSWGDMAANAFGSGLFIAQQLAWKEQRIMLKLGYTPYHYPADLLARRNNLFGSSLPERVLKDYNSQTYWASVNVAGFLPDTNFPQWLNIAFGYGSDGMMGARSNIWTDSEGKTHDYSSVSRTRRFYLSPDIDLTRIKTKSKLLRSAFFILNIIKIPAPAIELNSKGKLIAHSIKF
ncbi:MAG: DUF2279 domain-containing protein [Chitinophagaceae bacterium]|nr:DUF2279 domain-containing protein [Chitinophagaceae bacterium]